MAQNDGAKVKDLSHKSKKMYLHMVWKEKPKQNVEAVQRKKPKKKIGLIKHVEGTNVLPHCQYKFSLQVL